MTITFFSTYRDGGSRAYMDEHGREYVQYYGIGREKSPYFGKWFYGYPTEDKSNLIPDEVVSSLVINGHMQPLFPEGKYK